MFYSVKVSNIELTVNNDSHLLLLEFMLKDAFTRLNSVELYLYEHSTDRVYLYLIQNPSNEWLLEFYPRTLDAHITRWFKYSSVTELTIDDLKALLKSKDKRHQLLSLLLLGATPLLTFKDVEKTYQSQFN